MLGYGSAVFEELKQGKVLNTQCSLSWWWDAGKMEQHMCGVLQRSLLVFVKRFQDKTSKSSKELFRDASSDSHDILDTCSLSIVPTPAHYTTGSSTLIQDSRKKMEITEGRVNPFVVSELLQVLGETKLKTEMDCALKHCSQVKETEK